MSLKQYKEVLVNPLIKENPITLQILGICSALAVTIRLDQAIIMTLAVFCFIAHLMLYFL